MVTSKHCQARMSQRGLSKRLLDLVLEYGNGKGDKLILNRKTTQAIIDELDAKKKQLLKVMDKGGVTVVIQDDRYITTYNTNK